MRHILLIVSLFAMHSVWAVDSIQSDCQKPELKALKNKKILEQIAADSKLNAVDCTVIKSGASEKLLAVFSMDTPSGVETHVAFFARNGFSPDAKYQFRSESLGFDSYLVVAKGKKRLLFVMPGGNGKIFEFYTVTQTDANTVQFLKRTLDVAEKSLGEVADHAWKIDSGLQPKIYNEKGKWKAILKGKIVDL